MNALPELATPEELAEYLGLGPRTLQNWRAARRGPHWVRVSGNVVRYRKQDVDAFLAEQVQQPNPQEYRGWTNRTTWLVYTHLTSEEHLYTKACTWASGGPDMLKQAITEAILYEPEAPGAIPALSNELLTDMLDTVDWAEVSKALVEGGEA